MAEPFCTLEFTVTINATASQPLHRIYRNIPIASYAEVHQTFKAESALIEQLLKLAAGQK